MVLTYLFTVYTSHRASSTSEMQEGVLPNPRGSMISLVCFGILLLLARYYHFDNHDNPVQRGGVQTTPMKLVFQKWVTAYNKTYRKDSKELDTRFANWMENHCKGSNLRRVMCCGVFAGVFVVFFFLRVAP